jgi:hypothetical protein
VDNDLTDRAERAALGAMISDQRQVAKLGCLLPENFTDPQRHAVFQAIRLLSDTPQLPPGRWRDLIAQTADGLATRDYLDRLAADCPDPDHGPGYAVILISTDLYRQALDRADQLEAQALLPDQQANSRGDVRTAGLQQEAVPCSHLAEVARALRAYSAILAGPTPGSAAGPSAPDTRLRTEAPRIELAPPGSVQHREELVLSALLREHPQAGQILSFLPAAAFTTPARQEIFRAIHRLDQAGRPVDELTVAWNLATRSAQTAVLTPATAPQPQVPVQYIDKLATTGINVGVTPLTAARQLDARFRQRISRYTTSGTAQTPTATTSPAQARQPGRAQRQEPAASAQAPPPRPPNVAHQTRPAGPEPRR